VAKKTSPPAAKKTQVKKAAPAQPAPKRIAKKVGRKAVSTLAPPAPQSEAAEAASA